MHLIVKTVFGSHLYGLETPESDKDFKGVFMPSYEQILLNRVPKQFSESTGSDSSKNSPNDVDYECFSLYEFVRLALAGETVALDMLHTPQDKVVGGLAWEYSHNPIGDIWGELVQERKRFYSKDMKAYLGYVRRQASKYGVKGGRLACVKEVLSFLESIHQPKDSTHRLTDYWGDLPDLDFTEKSSQKDRFGVQRNFYQVCDRKLQDTLRIDEAINVLRKIEAGYGDRARKAEKNDSVDWKAVSHALRAGYQLRAIYKHGDFEYPLCETTFLYQVKNGLLDFKTQVQPELESLVEECEVLAYNSNLPQKPDHSWWDDWIIQKVEEAYL